MGVKVGSSDITKAYLGSTSVSAIYLGSTQVWGGGAAVPDELLIVSGQSNSMSKGVSSVPVQVAAIDSNRVKIWNGSAFVGYVAGTNSEPTNVLPTKWGPEAQYAIRFLADNATGTLYIVKRGVDATAIATWRDGAANFDALESACVAAKAALVSAGVTLTKAPRILWCQGESDAIVSASQAIDYQNQLPAFISEARSLWGSASSPIAIMRIYNANMAYGSYLRAAQNNVAAADALAYLINTDDQTLVDTYHYDNAGVIAMGDRMYSAIKNGVGIESTDTTAPTITSASSFSIVENNFTVATLTANEPVTWSKVGGADQAKFTIDTYSGALSFAAAPDFETPTDAGGNNVYDVTARATDLAGNTADQAIAVTVTDQAEGGPTATVTYTDHGEDISDLTTYTFSGKSFGTAAADRRIVVGISTRGSAPTITSVTIGGVAATSVVEVAHATNNRTAFYIADVPSGATGSVVVTFNAQTFRCGLGVWALYGTGSATPTATATSITSPATATMTVPAGGVAIGYILGLPGVDATWGNMTERFDILLDTNIQHSGADMSSPAGGSFTFTTTWSGTITAGTGAVFAVWGP